MPISIRNDQAIPVNTSLVRRAARSILRSEGAGSAEVSFLLTDDATIHALNRSYRSQDKPTDVLSFALRDQGDTERGMQRPFPGLSVDGLEQLGDVVISVETALRQAEQFHMTIDAELALLAVHGILHLLGYDDVTDDGAQLMTRKETTALAAVGIARR